MRRGWRLGGLILALFTASFPARAAAPAADEKADAAAVQKAREQIRDELRKPTPDYEEIEKPLEELLKKARETEAGAPLTGEPETEEPLRAKLDQAIVAGKYDLAAYYLDRIKLVHDKPNPFGGWLDLTIWTIVVFLLLLWVLGKFAWKPMLQGLRKRETDIHSAVEDARKAREEATRLREEVQAERVKTEAMRRDIIQKAEGDALRRAEEITTAAEAKMKAERDRAMRELETAKDQALQDIWKQAANLASVLSTKTIRRNLTPDDHRRFVDEALVELREAGNGQKTSASV
jgi:F-type H+-transporting ATPase subunit b